MHLSVAIRLFQQIKPVDKNKFTLKDEALLFGIDYIVF